MTAITHGTLGSGTSLVGTPASTTIANKSLVAESNLAISSSSTEITISTVIEEMCIIRNSTNTSFINGSAAFLTFDTEEYDPSGMFTSGNPNIDVQSDGIYQVNVIIGVDINASVTNGVMLCNLYHIPSGGGGTVIGRATVIPSGAPTGSRYMSLTRIYQASTGDSFQVQIQNGSGQTINVLSSAEASPMFSVTKISN